MEIMTAAGDREYNRPPVRVTVFTVFFQPFDLDLSVVTDLRNEWAGSYPGFKQVSPLSRRSDLLPTSDLFTLRWPMPAAQMADSSLSRTLAFQFDQFSLKWKFDTDAEQSAYPGYATLADELVDRFTEFVRIVDAASDSTITVEGCQCFYTNTLDGIGGRKWLTSFLSVDGTAGLLDDAEHFGFRIYREDELDGLRRSVSLQMDAGRQQRPEVDIAAVATPAEDSANTNTEPRELARRLLDAAHNLENQTFESSFSETMKKDWKGTS
jgi:uncharacterized protein (TIGR04255 family)